MYVLPHTVSSYLDGHSLGLWSGEFFSLKKMHNAEVAVKSVKYKLSGAAAEFESWLTSMYVQKVDGNAKIAFKKYLNYKHSLLLFCLTHDAACG